MSEQWANADGAIVAFDVGPSGHVLIERQALALLLVAAGFAQDRPDA